MSEKVIRYKSFSDQYNVARDINTWIKREQPLEIISTQYQYQQQSVFEGPQRLERIDPRHFALVCYSPNIEHLKKLRNEELNAMFLQLTDDAKKRIVSEFSKEEYYARDARASLRLTDIVQSEEHHATIHGIRTKDLGEQSTFVTVCYVGWLLEDTIVIENAIRYCEQHPLDDPLM